MNKGIIAKKVGMTQIFNEIGERVAVTVLEAGPCPIVQIKTKEKEGYDSLQLAFGEIKAKRANKAKKGHFDKAAIEYKKVLKEFRFNDISGYELGQEVKADIFEIGERIDVTGVTKGKGFQGNIKRHGYSKGPMSHGSKHHRRVGAMAAATTPGKVRKGKKLPGHMGHEKVTVQNLLVVDVNTEDNYILVKGAVPGPRGTIVVLKDTVKTQ